MVQPVEVWENFTLIKNGHSHNIINVAEEKKLIVNFCTIFIKWLEIADLKISMLYD